MTDEMSAGAGKEIMEFSVSGPDPDDEEMQNSVSLQLRDDGRVFANIVEGTEECGLYLSHNQLALLLGALPLFIAATEEMKG